MRAEGVEAGVLQEPTGAAGLPAEGGHVDRGHRRHRGHGGRAVRLELALVGVALRGPDGAEQAGHGRQAAGTVEVWLGGGERRKATCYRLVLWSWVRGEPWVTVGRVSECESHYDITFPALCGHTLGFHFHFRPVHRGSGINLTAEKTKKEEEEEKSR